MLPEKPDPIDGAPRSIWRSKFATNRMSEFDFCCAKEVDLHSLHPAMQADPAQVPAGIGQ